MTLPYDVARCQGSWEDDGGWREGCEDCLRRTSPGHPRMQAWMPPPTIIVFECEGYIPPDVTDRRDPP